jgi:hypothetical protein
MGNARLRWLLGTLFSPAPAALDFHRHRNSIGVEGVQSWVNDLVYPGDHHLLHEPKYLLGLILQALHYQLLVCEQGRDTAMMG